MAVLFKCYGCDIEEISHEFALKYGLIKLKRIGSLNGYLFQIPKSKRYIIDSDEINNEDYVEFSEIQVPVKYYKRFVSFSDPLYHNQWHYFNENSGNINIQKTWENGYNGAGITIAIVDDGILTTHHDISLNFNPFLSYNYNQNNDNVNPSNPNDFHGTLVAGAAAAKDEGSTCGVGVAYNASISGIVVLQDSIKDSTLAEALIHELENIDIYSNSWGPMDGGHHLYGPGKFTKLALEMGITKGRKGKGAIYVWAAGNGGYWDNCNYDGFASWRKAITTSSINQNGKSSYFAEECASNLIVAPGENIISLNISHNSECSYQFSGTSASTPIVSGVIALMLQANPELNWLDIQRIFIETSKKIDHDDRSWFINGGGHWVSHKYGYGLIDASSAVQRAIELRDEESLKEEVIVYHHNKSEMFIGSISKTIEVDDSCLIHHVELNLKLTYHRFGDLYIELISPYGTRSIFAKPHNDNISNLEWTFTSKLLWGEESEGSWTIYIASNDHKKKGTLNKFQLLIYGHSCKIIGNNSLKSNSSIMYITIIILFMYIFM